MLFMIFESLLIFVSFMVHKSPSSDMSKWDVQGTKVSHEFYGQSISIFLLILTSIWKLFIILHLKCKHTTMYARCWVIKLVQKMYDVRLFVQRRIQLFSFHIFLWKMIAGISVDDSVCSLECGMLRLCNIQIYGWFKIRQK